MTKTSSSSTPTARALRQTLVDNDYDPERIKVVSDGYEAWVDTGLPTEVSTARMWC